MASDAPKYFVLVTEVNVTLELGKEHAPEACVIEYPEWASKMRFVSHLGFNRDSKPSKLFNVTECASGLAIVRDCKTREGAVKEAGARLRAIQEEKFLLGQEIGIEKVKHALIGRVRKSLIEF